jgi:hypothetical protein
MLPIGIVAIIPAIIWIYVLHKGGQVTSMQKELKKIRMMEEEKQRLDLERRRDALSKGWD